MVHTARQFLNYSCYKSQLDLAFLILFAFFSSTLGYSEETDSKNGWVNLQRNLRVSTDLSVRVLHDSQRNEFASMTIAGADIHKIFSSPAGDWGTLRLQGYLTRTDNLNPHPGHFEDDDDWEFLCRFCDFNFTGFSRGVFNVRVGHFEIPYGLEQVMNTNGTLRDYISGQNLGIKADWGMTVNGSTAGGEYEFSWTRGSGAEWSSRGDPFIVSGRIGTSRDAAFRLGISGFHGRLYIPGRLDQTLNRNRYGFDFASQIGPVIILAETSIGRDDRQDVFNSIIELDWQNPFETLLMYVQFQRFDMRDTVSGWDDSIRSNVGLRYGPDNHWTFSGQWTHDLTVRNGSEKSNVMALQLRYRF